MTDRQTCRVHDGIKSENGIHCRSCGKQLVDEHGRNLLGRGTAAAGLESTPAKAGRLSETHEAWLLRNIRAILAEVPKVSSDELIDRVLSASGMPGEEQLATVRRLMDSESEAMDRRLECCIREVCGDEFADRFRESRTRAIAGRN